MKEIKAILKHGKKRQRRTNTSMPSSHALVILILPFFSCLLFINAQSSFNAQLSFCNETISFMNIGRNVSNCKNLEGLGAVFGWNYYSTDSHNHTTTIDIFFGARIHSTTGWVAWGVNPLHRPRMVGTRALIAFINPNGTQALKTYNITKQTKLGCGLLPSVIEIGVHNDKSAYRADTGFLAMSATLTLPSEYNISKLNHVWQVGPFVVDLMPQMHGKTLQNVDSTEIIDLNSRKGPRKRPHNKRLLRYVHGILSTLGWGTLFPIGAIIVRYFRGLPWRYRGWYLLHISCQILAFTIGTTGWAIGLWLGHASKDYTFSVHRKLGIIIFSLATLQMLALRIRPSQRDEYRQYWNIYHHLLGYGLIVAIIVNIFKGISILNPPNEWKWAYVGILVTLGSVALVFEVLIWIMFKIRERKNFVR